MRNSSASAASQPSGDVLPPSDSSSSQTRRLPENGSFPLGFLRAFQPRAGPGVGRETALRGYEVCRSHTHFSGFCPGESFVSQELAGEK